MLKKEQAALLVRIFFCYFPGPLEAISFLVPLSPSWRYPLNHLFHTLLGTNPQFFEQYELGVLAAIAVFSHSRRFYQPLFRSLSLLAPTTSPSINGYTKQICFDSNVNASIAEQTTRDQNDDKAGERWLIIKCT